MMMKQYRFIVILGDFNFDTLVDQGDNIRELGNLGYTIDNVRTFSKMTWISFVREVDKSEVYPVKTGFADTRSYVVNNTLVQGGFVENTLYE